MIKSQRLTARQKKIVKLAYECGIVGFAEPYEQGECPELPSFSTEKEWDDFEGYLRALAELQRGLRSPN